MKKGILSMFFSGCLVLCCFCLRRAVRNLIVWLAHNMPFPTRLPVYLYFIYFVQPAGLLFCLCLLSGGFCVG